MEYCIPGFAQGAANIVYRGLRTGPTVPGVAHWKLTRAGRTETNNYRGFRTRRPLGRHESVSPSISVLSTYFSSKEEEEEIN